MSLAEWLLASLRGSVADPDWVIAAVHAASSGSRSDLLTAYTAASRRAGAAPLHRGGDAAPAELQPFSPERWTCQDAARLLFLLTRHAAARDEQVFFADALACYDSGDSGEQHSWLRTVALLPRPERLLPVVIDACRTNILPLFEAVACENPYPATYFPERNFNQMVLKALFNQVALSRIVNFDRRLNAELTRMATDYAAERTAAGRPVPHDILLAMATPPERNSE